MQYQYKVRSIDEMALSKLSPTMITLSLVAMLSLMGTLSPRVMSMKTGYDYSTTGNPTLANQYRDIKCSYLFIAMTQMRLVRYLLDDKNTETSVPVYSLSKYDIRAVICTLYGVADVEIGTLWILLLYINMARPYYAEYISSAKEAERPAIVNHLVLVHDYVAGRMFVELSNARCRRGNQYDSYDERYRRLTLAKESGQFDMKLMQDEAIDNCKDLDDLLVENNAHLTYGKRYEAMRPRALFLDKLLDNNKQKSRLMDSYDLQIIWKGTPTLLTKYFEDAHKLHSNTVLFLPLFPVKMYYKAVFGLIKCITYRLAWKFVFYFNGFTGRLRENHLQRLNELLVKIQTKLHLQDDLDFTHLLDYIDQFGRNIVDLDTVITMLTTRLQNFEVILQCDATKSWISKSEQPSTSAQQGMSNKNDNIQGILYAIRDFHKDLHYAFVFVDFDVVWSIVNYIEGESKW